MKMKKNEKIEKEKKKKKIKENELESRGSVKPFTINILISIQISK